MRKAIQFRTAVITLAALVLSASCALAVLPGEQPIHIELPLVIGGDGWRAEGQYALRGATFTVTADPIYDDDAVADPLERDDIVDEPVWRSRYKSKPSAPWPCPNDPQG